MSLLKGEGKVLILFGTRSVVSGAITHEVYMARPDLSGDWPTAVIFPSEWGITSSMKELARRLARQGLAVIVVDPYRGEPPERAASLEEAEAVFATVPIDRVLRDGADVIRYIENPAGFWSTAEHGFAVIGIGSAGTAAARTAAATGAALVLVSTTPDLTEVSGPILGLIGKADETIPESGVADARNAAPYSEWVLYEDVGRDLLDDYLENFDQQVFDDAIERIADFVETHLSFS